LDPDLTDGVPEGKIEEALFEGLVNSDPKDASNCVPGVAESWEYNHEYSAWTFHLQNNAKWSNGDPLTADDFVFSIKRVLTGSLGAPLADYVFVIRGAREYLSGEIHDFDQVGVHLRLQRLSAERAARSQCAINAPAIFQPRYDRKADPSALKTEADRGDRTYQGASRMGAVHIGRQSRPSHAWRGQRARHV
jgi:hypothetical protein